MSSDRATPSGSGPLDAPLQDELAEVASDRVNALPSVVAERYAALRYRLDRVNEVACDAYATAQTPGLGAGTPVECKAVRVAHADQEGRFAVHPESHETLCEADGVYAVVVYAAVEVGGEDRIVVLESEIVDATEVGRWIRCSGEHYQRVRWSLVVDADVDEARWSR